jgi:hypothetical protein
MIKEVNYKILSDAAKIRFSVSSYAPNTENALFTSTSLVIWDGESNNTIFDDQTVNWAFRALHDALHLKTRLDFSPKAEIELGRIQASKYSGLLADLIYIEVAGQAEYYLNHGIFCPNQRAFTLNQLQLKGWKL